MKANIPKEFTYKDELLYGVRTPGLLEIKIHTKNPNQQTSPPMTRLIADLVNEASLNPAIKCIMIYGSERVFSSGIDFRLFLNAKKITMEVVKPPI